MIWTATSINQALNANLPEGDDFNIVQFNSLDVKKGDIFIALQGGKRDGHQFVQDAFDRGAELAIVSQDVELKTPKAKIIKVNNTNEALLALAEYKRQKSKAKFIGVTGSVGKTSTKEIIALMLTPYGKVFAGRGNFNNHLGVPINLASIANDDKFVIIEMGMNASGEISRLTKQVNPDIAIITSVAAAHMAFFESLEKIADAKSEIFYGLDVNSGIAILNRDISTYKRCMGNIDLVGVKNVKTFGCHQQADVRFVAYEPVSENRVRLVYSIYDKLIEFSMNIIPKHMAMNFAAAFGVVHALGLDLAPAIEAIKNFEPAIGRGKVVEVSKLGKSYKIVADYYNANPESMRAGLEFFAQINNENKIAILGDMLELGKDEIKLHKELIPDIINAGVKKLFLVGQLMRHLKADIPSNISVYLFENSEVLASQIDEYITDNAVIFIKGSSSVSLKKIVQKLGVLNDL